MQALQSFDALAIASAQLSSGRLHQVPLHGPELSYTWGFSIDLGLTGLVFCAQHSMDGIPNFGMYNLLNY
jgi:hypothetical protein